MKTSVVLATYNGEKFIKKQLYSLLNQTQVPNEIIISDDCSSDNTINIISNFIEKFRYKNIQCSLEINKENQGFIKNFHNSLKRATGDIIFLCDQDDIWKPNKIKDICNLFKANSNISAIATAYEFIDENDNKVSVPYFSGIQHYALLKRNIKNKELIKMSEFEIVTANVSPGCTTAIRSFIKDYYVKNASLIIPHDWEINIYSTIIGQLYFYNDPLISYRIHQSNTIGLKYYSPELKKFFNVDSSIENGHNLTKNLSKFFSFYYPKTNDERINDYIDNLINFCSLL